ncbi:hypothetical protein HRE53_21390 [Acaryochloris sp. 'Moss Beach']|uniref:hypothetical protein n=1 Tax=Acaryochloris sp. 'Moss Beach' TaxID=2740837 RepID=UPI001F205BEC|nr:hypothetical protein [Acaryochloris sp. 'Moss Beach']UJB68960.1 hypothetical protein HRE53_21390 [Acaryochloris sp. 'Moss Beach']
MINQALSNVIKNSQENRTYSNYELKGVNMTSKQKIQTIYGHILSQETNIDSSKEIVLETLFGFTFFN